MVCVEEGVPVGGTITTTTTTSRKKQNHFQNTEHKFATEPPY